jgi:hypothetical protein
VAVRTRSWLAGLVGLWMAQPLLAGEPARLGVAALPTETSPPALSPNQQVANTIAQHLRESGTLRHYTIDIAFRDGIVELSGTVADQPQREEVLRLIQGVPGVERVRDNIQVAGLEPLTPAQAVLPGGGPELAPVPKRTLAGGEDNNGNNNDDKGPKGKIVEPVPIFQAPPTPNDLNPPKMPPYAWPTYAPYNNFSRVAYPTLYPNNAWPFIGPVNPFPKVPLGWRKVKLEWQDGHWFYSKTASGHDWWRLRYW